MRERTLHPKHRRRRRCSRERAAGVALALVAVEPAGAQHIVGDRVTEGAVASDASSLVEGPNLHLVQRLRKPAFVL